MDVSKIHEALWNHHQELASATKKLTTVLSKELGIPEYDSTPPKEGDNVKRVVSKRCAVDVAELASNENFRNSFITAAQKAHQDVLDEIEKLGPKRVLDVNLAMKSENFMLELFVYATIVSAEKVEET